MLRVLVPIACLGLAGCATAQMRLPEKLAVSAVRTELAGIGGWPSGKFTAGPYGGRFDRSLGSYSFSDATVTRSGHGDFTLAGPGTGLPIEGRCAMREHAADLGLVEVTLQPMAYRCELQAASIAQPGQLELRETIGGGSAITRHERHGEIRLGGDTVQFRSLHHIAGSRMPSLTPVGYVFERDGDQVAALELTGNPVLFTSPSLAAETARTINAAAVALAILWDPAVHDAE